MKNGATATGLAARFGTSIKKMQRIVKDLGVARPCGRPRKTTTDGTAIKEADMNATSSWLRGYFLEGVVPSEDGIRKFISDVLLIPKREELPRPGDAADWDYEKWGEWCAAHEMVADGKSKHGYIFYHRIVPFIRVSVSSTPGDHRASMNCASDFRMTVENCTKMIVALVKILLSDEALCKNFDSPESFGQYIMVHGNRLFSEKQNDGNVPTVKAGKMKELFRTLRDNGISKLDLAKAMCPDNSAQPAEEIMEILSKYLEFPDDADVPNTFMTPMREVLLLKEEERRIEKEAIRKQREAKNRPKPLAVRVSNAIGDNRDRIQNRVYSVVNDLQAVVKRLQEFGGNIPDPQLPPIEDADAYKFENEELKANLQTVQSELHASEARMLAMTDEIETLRAARGEADKAVREHLRIFAEIVRDTVDKAKTMNPFQLVEELGKLKAEAEAVIREDGVVASSAR